MVLYDLGLYLTLHQDLAALRLDQNLQCPGLISL